MSATSLKPVTDISLLLRREGAELPAPESEAPALLLASVLGPGMGTATGAWRVRVGAREEDASLDPSVDPLLVQECLVARTRVVVERVKGAAIIVGALSTQRPVVIDRQGHLEARAKRISLTGDEEVLLRAAGAFVHLRSEDVELYGKRVIGRARELCRILGRMVKIN